MDIPISLESIVSGLITALIIASVAIIWKWLLQVPVLNYLHATQNIKGIWGTKWESGPEELVINYQAGKSVSGIRKLHFDTPKEYLIRGQVIGDTVVFYCIPKHKGETIAGTLILQIIGTGHTLRGKCTGLEPNRDGLFCADNQWNRKKLGSS